MFLLLYGANVRTMYACMYVCMYFVNLFRFKNAGFLGGGGGDEDIGLVDLRQASPPAPPMEITTTQVLFAK